MTVDIIIYPFTNQMQNVMQLYDSLKKQLIDDVNLIIINNASADGMRSENFHTDKQIKYVSSDIKINDCVLLKHAILEESESEYINFIPPNCTIKKDYVKNLKRIVEDNVDEDIILGRVGFRKNKRSPIVLSDRRKKDNIEIPYDFFPESITIRREKLFEAGLFDYRLNMGDAIKLLCYHLIKSFDSKYDIKSDIDIILPRPLKKRISKNLKESLKNYNNYKFAFKNYNSKEVLNLSRGIEPNKIYHASRNCLIVLTSKNNENLEKLTRQQISKKDKLYIVNLPRYIPNQLQKILRKNNYENTIIINEDAKFRYPYFIDDFKIESYYNEGVILASNTDFSLFELRPSLMQPKMSIISPRNKLLNFNEELEWDDFFRTLAVTSQPDQTIGDLFRVRKRRATIVTSSGKAGSIKEKKPAKHRNSWYDWMED